MRVLLAGILFIAGAAIPAFAVDVINVSNETQEVFICDSGCPDLDGGLWMDLAPSVRINNVCNSDCFVLVPFESGWVDEFDMWEADSYSGDTLVGIQNNGATINLGASK